MAHDQYLYVLFIERSEESCWVAQCLNYDMAVQGKSLNDAMREFEDMMDASIEIGKELGLEPFHDVPPAPEKYWKMLDDVVRSLLPEPNDRLPPAHVIDSRFENYKYGIHSE